MLLETEDDEMASRAPVSLRLAVSLSQVSIEIYLAPFCEFESDDT